MTTPPSVAAETRGRLSRREIYTRLADGREQLNRMGGLPTPVEAQDIWGDIWYAEAHNSTAIEGNTLVRKEVEILLREGRAVGNKQLADYLEVRGYADAAKWVYDHALEPQRTCDALISISEVRHIHQLIMGPVWDVAPHPQALPTEKPGNFREHDIEPFPGGMVPLPWPEVGAAVHDRVVSVHVPTTTVQPLPEILADWFATFERIHPFLDGNGRAGRLLLNLVLIRLGYPPAIVYKRQRPKYFDALRKADAGNLEPLGAFLARAILDTLYQFIVPAVAGPANLVPLAALADKTITKRALQEAALRGRLRAQHGSDGQWYSSRAWVEAYKKSRQRHTGQQP
jgi:hypothetical protein